MLYYLGPSIHAVFLLKCPSLPSQPDDILSILSFIHSLTDQYVMSTQIVPGAGDTAMNKTE